eukprot:TRINITY_DN1537_c2_g2_i1.p1 TRINITY_DN1537_c2_g2~~TRINITY_DN1537_c2_g2_i1.p1  ORF type:complete len:635 (-),score=146.40 TRINITY_DN1537_c2_g2_i1:66-1895(-)
MEPTWTTGQTGVAAGDAAREVICRCPPGGDCRGKWFNWLDRSKTTIYSMWAGAAQTFAAKPCLGHRPGTLVSGKPKFGPYEFLTFAETSALVDRIASALANVAGVDKGHMVGLMGENSVEWYSTMLATQRIASITVPLYASFGIADLKFILGQTELTTAVCNYHLLPKLYEAVTGHPTTAGPQPPAVEVHVRHVICMGNPDLCTSEEAKRALALFAKLDPPVDVTMWDEFLNRADTYTVEHPAPPPAECTPEDTCCLIYTSGVQGNPKGAMIAHRNLVAVADISACSSIFVDGITDGVHYSYLPLSHCFEMAICLCMLRGGARIGFTCGNIANLLEDIEALKPTYFFAVPRVLKRLKDKVMETVGNSSWLTQYVFNWAVGAKAQARQTGVATWIDWDKWVLHAVQEKLGGYCKFMIVGAAPLDAHLAEWVEDTFNVRVNQGYGLTESCAATTVNRPGCPRMMSSIGYPLPSNLMRLVDCPEMEYLTSDTPPHGEIQLKGEMIFKGYYHNEEETSRAFTKDGWLATGDIGMQNPDGSFSVIDRKKNLFKMQQGEYISVELVEAVILSAPEITQAWVNGEPTDNFLVAVVVPNCDMIAAKLPQIPRLPNVR